MSGQTERESRLLFSAEIDQSEEGENHHESVCIKDGPHSHLISRYLFWEKDDTHIWKCVRCIYESDDDKRLFLRADSITPWSEFLALSLKDNLFSPAILAQREEAVCPRC